MYSIVIPIPNQNALIDDINMTSECKLFGALIISNFMPKLVIPNFENISKTLHLTFFGFIRNT